MSEQQTHHSKSAGHSILQRASSGLLQRKCDTCGQHTIAGATCSSCEKKTTLPLQRKLMIGASNDPLEQEADRVADQVIAMETPIHCSVMSSPPQMQRHSVHAPEELVTAPASVEQAMSSPGRPLEPSLQQDMEQRFGHDFSQVRIHTGAEAQRSARDVNANAYTLGHDVVFRSDQFAPETRTGRRLLAHELTHVIQQSASNKNHLGQASAKRNRSIFASNAPCASNYEGNISRVTGTSKCLTCEEDTHQLMRKESSDKSSQCTPTPYDPFCLGIPEPNTPCKPFSRPEQAEAAWDALSVQIPLLTASFTGCNEVKPVWESYFARTSIPFSFSNPSSCVVSAAKTDQEGSNTANRASKYVLKDIIDYLPFTLLDVNLSPFPLDGVLAERRLPLEEAIGPHGPRYLHPDITYNYPFNAAANIAGAMGIGGQGSDVFGDDDRVMGGIVIIEVNMIDPTGIMTGQVRWQPRIHVKDTVDFCPGNMGNSTQHQFTVPMSKLESMGYTKDVPITIDYDLELQQAVFHVLRASGPPKLILPQPNPHQPALPQPNSRFSSRRFIGQPTLEACGAAKHRMLRGETDHEAVRIVQETLVEAGIPTEATGIYSDNTKQAVAQFKREYNPPIVPSDGVVGPKTSHALDKVAAEHGQ